MKTHSNGMMSGQLARLLLWVPLLLSGCARNESPVNRDAVTPAPRPAVETRRVMVTGEVLTLPPGLAAPEQLVPGRLLTEGDVQALENAAPGTQVFFRPRMTAPDGDTGRFKLTVTNQPSFVAIELTPKIGADGRVALHLKVDASSAGGAVDTLNEDRLFQPNSGIYQVFGPLQFEGRKAYVVLKADVRQG